MAGRTATAASRRDLRRHQTAQDRERLLVGPAWHDSDLVFTTALGTLIHPRNLSRDFQAAVRRAGVRPIRLHGRFRFYGLSVFAALDGDVPGLCRSVPRLRTPGTIWLAMCGELRRRGFRLLATDARPHFDIVLGDVAPGTIESLVACFTAMPNPTKQR